MFAEQRKALVIGLDGATFDVLNPLMEKGIMPNLASLMERGCWGKLASVVPPFTAAAWSSFITGQNPGQHGVLSFHHTRDRFNYDVQGNGFVSAKVLDRTIWEILSAAGKRVGIVNVPLTYPVRAVNGYMISGMLTPLGSKHFVYPPDLIEDLAPNYVIDVDFIRDKEGFRIRGFPTKQEMLAQIRNMSEIRSRTCIQLLQTRPWDFFMVVFTGTDRILHFFWDDLSPIMDGTIGINEAITEGVKGYFQELDDAIGQLIDLGGSSTTTLVISDHGFGSAQTSRFYVNVWLEKLGFLKRRGSEGILDMEYWRVIIGRNKRLKSLLRCLLFESTQDKLSKVSRTASKDILDWSKTRAYYVPIYFHVCGVEINLSGDRREGCVQLGAEYETLRDRIIHEAKQLRDPRNGRPIVKIAARREDFYHGSYVGEFPDVILVLDPDYIGASSLAGSSLVEPHSPTRSGEHRQDGILIAAGPFISPRGEFDGGLLIDIPPTILYALGQSVPMSFDGQVLKDIFDPMCLAANPVQIRTLSLSKRAELQDVSGYSESEEARIEDRLRGLGYID